MKTLHLHATWAVVSFVLAGAAWIASGRSGGDSGPAGAAPVDARALAAMRARVAELEAERDLRKPGEEPPARPPESPATPPTEAKPAAATPLGIDQIRALLKSPKKEDQSRAVQEIEAMSDRRQKLALLRAMVESGDRGLVSRAVSLLRKTADPESVALLATVLATEGPSGPRWQAAVALGDLGDPSAISPLREAFRSSDLHVRSAAGYALDKFGQPEAAQAAMQTIAGMLQSPDGGIREDAVDLLTHIAMPGSLPLLVGALGDVTNNHVREDAADALGARKMVEALPYLEKALQDPAANVREAAQRAINRVKSSTKP
ncbi:MAG TPA: HEAT repeat domain-containing protein [Planctomycetota bacterium]|nr:HEAT repeat domain-containing protein [Planctomycetota bacterium]